VDKDNNSFYFLLLSSLGGSKSVEPVNISSEPILIFPEGVDSNAFSVRSSSIVAPNDVNGYIPIGKSYDIDLLDHLMEKFQIEKNAKDMHFYFNDNVKLEYTYDLNALTTSGFIEEFAGFYYDYTAKSWEAVDGGVTIDRTNSKVTVITRHLSTFI